MDDGRGYTDYSQLKQAWLNERCSPEVLVYQKTVVERLSQKIKTQEEVIQKNNTDVNQAFMVNLLSLELERAKYIIKAYLRARLEKIEQNVIHILNTKEERDRLSDSELQFAQAYHKQFTGYMTDAALSQMPEPARSLTEKANGDLDMVPLPNLDVHVFCRVNEHVGEYLLEDEGDANIYLDKDDIYILRYKSIRSLLLQDKVGLI
eukprot:TRINITY_DN6562_c0_g1_i1.p1 TRINITY_DN6562_c0_g1~~TRINITY_DN6562_c0_g1_i1.p1  ORF type:complete len:206 (-),score=34.87 TRINITY_DN6562_c0_g1_i1:288-905(-)